MYYRQNLYLHCHGWLLVSDHMKYASFGTHKLLIGYGNILKQYIYQYFQTLYCPISNTNMPQNAPNKKTYWHAHVYTHTTHITNGQSSISVVMAHNFTQKKILEYTHAPLKWHKVYPTSHEDGLVISICKWVSTTDVVDPLTSIVIRTRHISDSHVTRFNKKQVGVCLQKYSFIR